MFVKSFAVFALDVESLNVISRSQTGRCLYHRRHSTTGAMATGWWTPAMRWRAMWWHGVMVSWLGRCRTSAETPVFEDTRICKATRCVRNEKPKPAPRLSLSRRLQFKARIGPNSHLQTHRDELLRH